MVEAIGKITEQRVFRQGLSAWPLDTGFVAVDLGFECDPDSFPEAIMDLERKRLPAWMFRKEYLRDWDAQIGMPVFDVEKLDAAKVHLRNPLYRMDLDGSGELTVRKGGRLAVYMEPDAQPENLPDNVKSVKRGFVIGMDVSAGVGLTDSTMEVFSADTLEQAAELADPNITPQTLGIFAAAVGRWYNNAMINCVNKIHGLTTIRAIVDDCKYFYVWHNRLASGVVQRRTDKLGWGKGEQTDELLFDTYLHSLEAGNVTIRSKQCHTQHYQYVWDEKGKACLKKRVGENEMLRRRHADMVVGCGLAFRCAQDVMKTKGTIFKALSPIAQYLKDQRELKASPWRK